MSNLLINLASLNVMHVHLCFALRLDCFRRMVVVDVSGCPFKGNPLLVLLCTVRRLWVFEDENFGYAQTTSGVIIMSKLSFW